MQDDNGMREKTRKSLTKQAIQNNSVKENLTRRTFLNLLEENKEQIQKALPKHISVERIIRVALSTVSKNPKLLECTPTSLFGAIIQASQLGLDIDVNGQCFLIPRFNNKTKILEANFQIGYSGLIELSQRTGRIASINANVVYENDVFDYEYGSNSFLKHKPTFEDKKGEMKCIYAYAKMTNDGFYFVVLSIAEIERIRAFSTSINSDVWDKNYEAMCKKTAIIQLAKYLPKSVEYQRALILEEMENQGISQGMDIRHVNENGELIINENDLYRTNQESK